MNTRSPQELDMEAQDMIKEMGFCPKCREHKPCGCSFDDFDTQIQSDELIPPHMEDD